LASTRKPRKPPSPDLPTREEILAFLADAPGRVGKREIGKAFNIKGSARIGLKRLLREMVEAGDIEGPKKKLRRPGDLPSVTVVLVDGIDADGELTASPLEWDESWGAAPAITLQPVTGRRKDQRQVAGVGDRALVRLSADAETGGFSAKVIKVLQKKPRTALGIFRKSPSGGRIVPIDRKSKELDVAAGQAGGADDGELVSIEVTRSGRFGVPVARIVERIGDVSSEKAISLIALEEHGIPYRFPDEVIAETDAARHVEMGNREDWRDLPLMTIDPADARDHDDAVHAMPDPDNEGGVIVTVAIADVTAYITEGSAADREAGIRGNSVYFPGRVVPMLPERISNDLCSLRETEDRPALAVRMTFDKSGRKTAHRFHRIMMRSALKLSYEAAQEAADGQPGKKAEPFATIIGDLWDAYAVLSRGRAAREPLEIEIPERRVQLKPDGSVDRIFVPPRLDAHKLIEEFMIQANVCAAETLEKRRAPTVYRIHDEPSMEKLEALRDFLGSLDMSFPKSGALRPSHFNNVLRRVHGTPNAVLVNEVILRSQSQAEYSTQNIGHFGLNLRRYAHFTSPIRRYADLLIHRALVGTLRLGKGGSVAEDVTRLERISAEISVAERRAMKAERDTRDRLIALWLADRIGARFAGHIRGVTRAGLFVELDETGADGFVPISTLGTDFFEFEESHHRLVGRASGETFQLGMPVEVKLLEALPFAGSLRFEMETEGTISKRERPGRKTASRRKAAKARSAGRRKGRKT
jgi:ribonuclease R